MIFYLLLTLFAFQAARLLFRNELVTGLGVNLPTTGDGEDAGSGAETNEFVVTLNAAKDALEAGDATTLPFELLQVIDGALYDFQGNKVFVPSVIEEHQFIWEFVSDSSDNPISEDTIDDGEHIKISISPSDQAWVLMKVSVIMGKGSSSSERGMAFQKVFSFQYRDTELVDKATTGLHTFNTEFYSDVDVIHGGSTFDISIDNDTGHNDLGYNVRLEIQTAMLGEVIDLTLDDAVIESQ